MASPPLDPVMLERRAATLAGRSIKGSAKATGLRIALSLLDLTTLEGRDSPERVRAVCRKAMAFGEGRPGLDLPVAAAVCVYPALVPVAREMLAGSTVRVAAVATAFPSGQYPLDVRLADVEEAIDAGADEIDMVINRGAFLAGRLDVVTEEIAAVKQTCDRAGAGATVLKIILETGELETYDSVRRAADLAIEAVSRASESLGDGAVFLKTSTGKITPAATLPVTLVLLEAIRDHAERTGVRFGVKPAGGIRTARQALAYLVLVRETLGDAWLTPRLFRLGASALADDLVRQILTQRSGCYAAAYDVASS